ncbi:MAG: energy transducer TonB [Candidatus Sulfotelmatobacter sp.]|jgi:TonB family protein
MKPVLRHTLALVALALVPALTAVSANLFAQDHAEGGRKILVRVAPQYPPMARSMNIQGVVKADVLVAPNGTVKSVEIKGGHPLFVQSAQNALHEWKWEPAPHESHEIIELKFTL